MSRRFVPVQLALSWSSVLLSVLVVGFGVGTCIWEVDRPESWHAKSFGEGIIFATWAGFLLVWYIPCLIVSRRAWTTKWFNTMITDAVWLGLSFCFGTACIAVWGGHKQTMNAFLIVTGIIGCVLFAVQVTQLLFEVISVLVHHGGSKSVWKLSFHDLFAYPGDHARDPEMLDRYGRNPRSGRYTQNDAELSPTSSKSLELYDAKDTKDTKDYKDARDVKDYRDAWDVKGDKKTPASLLKHEYYDHPYEHKGKLAKSRSGSSGGSGSVRGDKKAIEAERELYAHYEQHKLPSYTSH